MRPKNPAAPVTNTLFIYYYYFISDQYLVGKLPVPSFFQDHKVTAIKITYYFKFSAEHSKIWSSKNRPFGAIQQSQHLSHASYASIAYSILFSNSCLARWTLLRGHKQKSVAPHSINSSIKYSAGASRISSVSGLKAKTPK